MKSLTTAMSLAGLLALAACNNPPPPSPHFDTGNMAYPTPQPTGNVATARPSGFDTGSVNQPTATGGVVAPVAPTPDTGNMALPNRAQGNSRPRSY